MVRIQISWLLCAFAEFIPARNSREPQQVTVLMPVSVGNLQRGIAYPRSIKICWMPVKFLVGIQYTLLLAIILKTFNLGYKKITEVKVIGNKGEHTY